MTRWVLWQIVRADDGSVKFQGNACGMNYSFDSKEDAGGIVAQFFYRKRDDEEFYWVQTNNGTHDWDTMERVCQPPSAA
jgi:hypothetical protein